MKEIGKTIFKSLDFLRIGAKYLRQLNQNDSLSQLMKMSIFCVSMHLEIKEEDVVLKYFLLINHGKSRHFEPPDNSQHPYL